MKYKDFLGNDIKVGDTIVYPGRVSSSLWMNKGVVKALTHVTDWYHKEPLPALKVEIDSERWNWKERKKYIKKMTVTVKNLGYCVVVGR